MGEQQRGSTSSPWNSLEITKIVVAATTPVAIALLGILVSANNSEQARLSRALDRRLEVWDTVGPKIRQVKDQTALIFMNYSPKLPQSRRALTIGAKGVLDIVHEVDERLEVRPFFTPLVAQQYIHFSNCAVELAQSAEFNAREGVQPFPRERLKLLWQKADQSYASLVRRVRVELSTESYSAPDAPYPHRTAQTGGRDSSLCLGAKPAARTSRS